MAETCGESFCDEPVGPGSHVVGGVGYCASHGYSHYLTDKRAKFAATVERERAESRQARERREPVEAEPPAKGVPEREWWADRVIRERAERRVKPQREWWADRVIRERAEREAKARERRKRWGLS